MSSEHRFFVEGTCAPGQTVEIAGADAHKISHVLRLREGDRVALIDSASVAFNATIHETGRIVSVFVENERTRTAAQSANLAIDVAQAVPKGTRMDYVIEKCTELGAAAFVPFFSERSVAVDVGAAKLSRWERLARTAAQQCGRGDLPRVLAPTTYAQLLERFGDYESVLFAWELAEPIPLADRLRAVLPHGGRVLIVVGPEGGFSHREAENAAASGAHVLWLGPRVLRTDTAAIVLLAVIGAFAS